MTQEVAEKPKERLHDQATITRALTELAACRGNSRMAARHLAEDKIDIEPSTIWRWGNKQHVDQYQRIRADLLPLITAAAVEQHMDLAYRQSQVAAKALERIESRIPEMEDKDLINAMGKADIGSGIHTEKAQLLAGQPTHRVARSSVEILRELKTMGVEAIDVEAVDVEIDSPSSDVAVPADATQSIV